MKRRTESKRLGRAEKRIRKDKIGFKGWHGRIMHLATGGKVPR